VTYSALHTDMKWSPLRTGVIFLATVTTIPFSRQFTNGNQTET